MPKKKNGHNPRIKGILKIFRFMKNSMVSPYFSYFIANQQSEVITGS